MTQPEPFDFRRYLAAKQTVDDRALNRPVLAQLTGRLADSPPPLRVVEVAAGIGTMLERLLAWPVLPPQLHYLALDREPAYIAEAIQRLSIWAERLGLRVEAEAAQRFTLTGPNRRCEVTFEASEVTDFIGRDAGNWDLLIAHAFLDLVDLPAVLPGLLGLLRPGGLFYFTINFDGETILLPEIEPALDQQIIRRYHQLMDRGRPAGHSRTGRALFSHLPAAGAEILAAGSSDWVVYAQNGRYPADEATFLHNIISTIANDLHGQSDLPLAAWLAERHAQIERGELTYIAHQLDFLGYRSA